MRRHAPVFTLVALVGAGLDLLTKKLALDAVPNHGEIPVINGLFSIGHEHNPGVIWSFGPGARTLWLVISILAVPLIFWIFTRSRRTWTTTICLGMIEAGTIGNCWDRIFHPGVRDFIKFYYVRSNGLPAVWPLFNLADSCIVVGVILLSIELSFFEEKRRASLPKKDATGDPAASPEAFRERFRNHLVGSWILSSRAAEHAAFWCTFQFHLDGSGWFSSWDAGRGETRESLEWRNAGVRCIEARIQSAEGRWGDWARISYDFYAEKTPSGKDAVFLYEPVRGPAAEGKGFWRSPLPMILVPEIPPSPRPAAAGPD